MTPSRLPILLAVLTLLVALRVAAPPASREPAPALAVVRAARLAAAQAPSMPARPAASPGVDAGDERSAAEPVDVPGNAFIVRAAPPPPEPAPMPAAPVPLAVAAPRPPPASAQPLEPVEPMPPLQVIGTYDDGQTSAVFIATPLGTRIARAGTTLMAEYQVAAIAPGRVSLVRLSNRRPFELAAPAPGRP